MRFKGFKGFKEIVLDLIEKEEHRKTLWRILIFMLAVTVIADLLVERHAEFAWIFPGFAALYGFVSCVFIIVFSKWIGHKWLMKDEDYWDRQDLEEVKETGGSGGSGGSYKESSKLEGTKEKAETNLKGGEP